MFLFLFVIVVTFFSLDDIALIELIQLGHICIFAFFNNRNDSEGWTKELRSHRSGFELRYRLYTFLHFIPETIPKVTYFRINFSPCVQNLLMIPPYII